MIDPLNRADLVFEQIGPDTFVMAKNRFGQTTNRVYSINEIFNESMSKYTIEIIRK